MATCKPGASNNLPRKEGKITIPAVQTTSGLGESFSEPLQGDGKRRWGKTGRFFIIQSRRRTVEGFLNWGIIVVVALVLRQFEIPYRFFFPFFEIIWKKTNFHLFEQNPIPRSKLISIRIKIGANFGIGVKFDRFDFFLAKWRIQIKYARIVQTMIKNCSKYRKTGCLR